MIYIINDLGILEEIPPFLWEPTEIQFRQYAEATGHYEPIHLDRNYAQKAGLVNVVAQGMLVMAQVAHALTSWVGDRGVIRLFEGRFLDLVYPGDRIICRGIVAEKVINAYVCKMWAQNQKEGYVFNGSAVVEFKNKRRRSRC